MPSLDVNTISNIPASFNYSQINTSLLHNTLDARTLARLNLVCTISRKGGGLSIFYGSSVAMTGCTVSNNTSVSFHLSLSLCVFFFAPDTWYRILMSTVSQFVMWLTCECLLCDVKKDKRGRRRNIRWKKWKANAYSMHYKRQQRCFWK